MFVMLKGFRKFFIRGNFVDMAVGVVVGGAFTTVDWPG
jgi:large-conductance mechanosensitive channel